MTQIRPVEIKSHIEHAPKLEAIIIPAVEEWAGLIPGWCNSVGVWYEGGDAPNGESALVRVETDYRFASITMKGQWLDSTPLAQRNMAAHEVCHIVIEPLAVFAKDLIVNFVPEAMRDYFRGQLTKWVEAVTTDMADGICRMVPAQPMGQFQK